MAMPSRLRESIAAAVERRRIAFLPFLPGGYPTIDVFKEALRALCEHGADAVEIGFPFSDPIADGPTIQAAFAETLRRGVTVDDILAAVGDIRRHAATPFCAMVSYSIVFRRGGEKFFEECRSHGFDGMIIPDLPPPEAQRVCAQIRSAGLDTILLAAPTTTATRRKEIAELCTGFIYYLSVSGITGERDALPPDLLENVRSLKALSDVPVCVGFGISRPEHLAKLAGVADGAIVGSAIVKRMQAAADRTPAEIARVVADYCHTLIDPL